MKMMMGAEALVEQRLGGCRGRVLVGRSSEGRGRFTTAATPGFHSTARPTPQAGQFAGEGVFKVHAQPMALPPRFGPAGLGGKRGQCDGGPVGHANHLLDVHEYEIL
jgi:hypothetical protein